MSLLAARAPCNAADPLRIAVLVSGHGSNLQALINDAKRPGCPYTIALVISNNPAAFALQRAQHAQLEHKVVHHRDYTSRDEFDKQLVKACLDANAEVVVLAGFMRLLGPHFLKAFRNLVINIHPALNPAFAGLHAPRQALDAGVWYTGCTIHLVNDGVDTGAIIAQSVVPILEHDNDDALTQRIHAKEHKLLKTVVRAIAKGKVLVDGERVRMQGRDKML